MQGKHWQKKQTQKLPRKAKSIASNEVLRKGFCASKIDPRLFLPRGKILPVLAHRAGEAHNFEIIIASCYGDFRLRLCGSLSPDGGLLI